MKLCDWLGERGVLLEKGRHLDTPGMCVLEAESLARGLPKTDDPNTLRTWDVRPLNDVKVSELLRTEYMCAIADLYCDCRDWPIERQVAVVSKIAVLTINRIIAELPHLSLDIAQACRHARTLDAARAAAGDAALFLPPPDAALDAAWAAAAAAGYAIEAAKYAAGYAGKDAAAAAAAAARAAKHAAEDTAGDAVFIGSCEIWIEAANA